MLVLFSFRSALALTAFGSYWVVIGAGWVPLLAGLLLLPIASAPWVFGVVGAAIAVSAVFCCRSKVSTP